GRRDEQTHEGGQVAVLVARERLHPMHEELVERVARELVVAPGERQIGVTLLQGVQPEAELGDDAEVAAAAAAQRLEQRAVLRVSRPGDLENLAVRGDDLDADQTVAGQTQLARSEAPAAPLRQSADVHVTAGAARKVVAAAPE